MFQSQQTQQADFTTGKLKARYTREVKRGSLHRPDLPWPVCHGPPRHPAVSLRATHGWWSQVLRSSLFSPSLARLSKRCLEPGLASSLPKPPSRFLSCQRALRPAGFALQLKPFPTPLSHPTVPQVAPQQVIASTKACPLPPGTSSVAATEVWGCWWPWWSGLVNRKQTGWAEKVRSKSPQLAFD